jgi:cytoskeleton protein RodZ
MSETTPGAEDASAPAPAPAPAAAATAGSLLREARLARGMHIAALANAMKVAPQKLEALEADRFDELPGTAFTRALAQTVCRTLKVDPAPVLALLPAAPGHGLEHMSRGINEPFRDRPGRQSPADLSFLKSPVRLGSIGLVVLAIVVYLLPAGWVGERFNELSSSTPSPAPSSASGVETTVIDTVVGVPAAEPVLPSTAASEVPGAPVTPAVPAIETVHSAPTEAAPAASGLVASPVAAASSAPLQLRATAESWVEVIDRRGVALFSRMLQPGETVGLDGAYPLRVKIGNAQATEVSFKGQRVDLTPLTSRDNVAKLELK